jgi:hypothetical protein
MTETPPSHGPGVTLREHFDQRFRDDERLQCEKWQAHDDEHAMLAKSLDIVADATREYRSMQNEWRATLSDRDSHYLPREVFETWSQHQEQKQQASERWLIGIFLSIGALTLAVVGLLLRALGI